MGSFLTNTELAKCAGADAAAKLTARGIAVDRFEWLLSARRVSLRDGTHLENVWCGKSGDLLHVFPLGNILKRVGWRDWEIESVAPAAVEAQILERLESVVLEIRFPATSRVQTLEVVFDEQTLSSAAGEWLAPWTAAITRKLELRTAPAAAGFVTRKDFRIGEGEFGLLPGTAGNLRLCVIVDQEVRFFPGTPLSCPHFHGWALDRGGSKPLLELLISGDGVPSMTALSEWPIADRHPLTNTLTVGLSESTQVPHSNQWQLSKRGIFEVAEGTLPPKRRVLRREEGRLIIKSGTRQPETVFEEGWRLDDLNVVLVAKDGTCVRVTLKNPGSDLLRELRPHHAVIHESDGRSWVAALVGDQAHTVILSAYEACIGTERLGFNETGPVEAAAVGDGSALVYTLVTRTTGATHQWRLLMPEKLAFALCEEWEVRRTRFHHATADLVRLYQEFNRAKKYNLLCVLFSDTMALNRRLNEGLPMNELIAQLQSKGASKFFEDGALRQATIEKVLTLSAAIPQIKRNFEQWAAIYAYHWAAQDSKWISSVFGSDIGRQLAAVQRKRKVPLVRQAVRNAQAGMQRAFAEIEMAIRPLEHLLAREEVQSDWAYHFFKFLPVGVQATGAVGAASVAAVVGVTQAPLLIGGAAILLTTMAVQKVSAKFNKTREDTAVFERAGKNAFPWWQVFMRTLGVALHETAEFIDEENVRGMKLDKQLLDSLPQERQPEMRRHLAEKLRERIIAEKRNGFVELLEGSGVRVSNVIEDIHTTIRREAPLFEPQFPGHSDNTHPKTHQ